MCTGTESSSTEFMQEKSFFCRISGGKEKEGDLQYYPFRMTPYLMKVQDSELSEEHFCCLILAERVHSGYEAPRIPPDKRIFTTTHTPNCVFQDVDERAVPLLGYLPQDLIGTPLLLHLHPSDRPIMLAVHRKILQYVGQPFDHSSIRFCVRNGEYVTLDTSWCSFVNPWSRKVSFVIGRHKVRMGPMNEDVFSAPTFTEEKIMDSDIQEITEQIHRLLLQPVHSMGSSGYGSHGSNGSHEHLLSIASSSDSNGNGNTANLGNRINGNTRKEEGKSKPRSFQEICKGVHMMKAQEQQGSFSKAEQKKSFDTGFRSSVAKQKDTALLVRDGPTTMENLKDHTMYSYQQISCLDSVIRYLESCNVPNTVKRKYQFSSNTTSSNSDEDKKTSDASLQQTDDSLCVEAPSSMSIKTNEKPPPGSAERHVVGGSLSPLDLPSKADSVVSQCSYSSTIVHVGDKKTQPESEIIEDTAESPAPSAPVSVVSPPTVEQEAYKKLGLTKQVLAAHTQKEEQAFLSRCRELQNGQALQKDCPPSTEKNRGQAPKEGVLKSASSFNNSVSKLSSTEFTTTDTPSGAHGTKAGGGVPVTDATIKKSWRTKKSKKPRTKHADSSDNAASQHRPLPPLQGLNQTSWSPSEASQSGLSVPFTTVVPGYPLYPVVPSVAPPQAPPTGVAESLNTQATPSAAAYPTPLVTPVVAFVLPSFMLPQIGTAPRSPFYADTQQAYSAVFQAQQTYNGQHPFQPQQVYNIQQPLQHQQVYAGQQSFQPQQAYSTTQHLQNTQGCSTHQCFQTHTSFTSQQPAFTPQTHFQYEMTSDPKHSVIESTECASPLPPPNSPPLFESRCSSPLQLDLLQMEEKQDSHTVAPQFITQGNCSLVQDKNNTSMNSTTSAMDDLQQACCSGNGGHCGDHSSSSSVLELLLQEDSHSGMGSAMSASTGSTSNDCNTFNSGTGSNTSKYFGSVDSSENNHKEQEQNFVKYVLQEPVWRLTADDDECVMMSYQVPSRDLEKVLGEDRERLRRMQKNQPRFSSEQRRELIDQHPWMRRGGLPNAINVMECMYCENDIPSPLEEDLPDMELGILGGEVIQDGRGSHSQEEKEQPCV
ncbi:hypothetical protein QQF64_007818 [Cirrhinus molitorella]|uniref:Period circadian protein homolog 2 n=1 Tax=Cirrhinus molitorella TaxID=172907 RepID=A0ABR3M6Z1_9TELE